MNGSDTTTHPEVTEFLAQVRQHLADLGEEEREELIGGLEADLSEQYADGDSLVGDPAHYAAELRRAAGLPEARTRRLPHPGRLRDLDPVAPLTAARESWQRLVDVHPWAHQAWEVSSSLRPAWWVLRAWLAVTLLDTAIGPWEPVSLIPTLVVPGLGLLLLLAAVTVSTLIGLGRLWPGSGPDRSPLKRWSLVGLNIAAIVTLVVGLSSPIFFSSGRWDSSYAGYGQGFRDGRAEVRSQTKGLRVDREAVRNIFAYDAQGRPLTSVQLFDQDGNPLALRPKDTATGRGAERTVGCPALNGTTPLYNAFPLAQLTLRRGDCTDAATGSTPQPATPPLAQVPPLTVAPFTGAPTEPAPSARANAPKAGAHSPDVR